MGEDRLSRKGGLGRGGGEVILEVREQQERMELCPAPHGGLKPLWYLLEGQH